MSQQKLELGNIGDVLSPVLETPNEVRTEILNLRDLFKIDQNKPLPNKLEDLIKIRAELIILANQKHEDKFIKSIKQQSRKKIEKLDNSVLRSDHPNCPKSGPGEACETPGCYNVVYGTARYCDECRKKKELEKQKMNGRHRFCYPDEWWKTTIPNILLLKEKLGAPVENLCEVYSKFINAPFAVGVFYRKKQDLKDQKLTPTLDNSDVEKFRLFLSTVNSTPSNPKQEVIAPKIDTTPHAIIREVDDLVLKEFHKTIHKINLASILDWITKIQDNEEAYTALQQIQEIINLKLQEVNEVRHKIAEEEAKKQQLLKAKEDLQKQLEEVSKQLG